jgi:nicotinate-nucleotide--dimethylbenzimidazole phosphoribosyltransferase
VNSETISATLDALAKPPGSLGLLESWAFRACALQGTLRPSFGRASVLVFLADHGVTMARPTVTAFPRAVTAALLKAVSGGLAPASVALAGSTGFADAEYVDVGVDLESAGGGAPLADGPVEAWRQQRKNAFDVHTWGSDKVCPRGSADFTQGPALTREELERATEAGRRAVRRAAQRALDADQAAPLSAVALGEMGLGNTTSAAALAAALTGAAPEEVCGRGTGVDDAGLAAKRQAVADALAANARLLSRGDDGAGKEQQPRALRALRAVGGLEVAAIAGAVWECADRGVAVIVDGFICGVAALAAVEARPEAARCLFLSHASAELGARRVLSALEAAIRRQEGGDGGGGGKEEDSLSVAPLDMRLRLGEATGAILALPLLRASAALVRDTALLSEVMAA